MKNESVIGLYSYALPHPGDEGFRSFYDMAMQLLQDVDLKPTYFAADGPGHKGEAVPLNGKSQKNSMSRGFVKASLVSLICNPEGSNAPAFDDFAEISLSFRDGANQTLVTFSVAQEKFDMNSAQFQHVIDRLLSFREWQFGYVVSSKETRNPSYYLLAADDGKMSKTEMDELLLWYNSEPAIRRSKVRNVHPINFLNEAQLIAIANNGQTLQSMIEADGGSVLKKVSDKLWRWDVPMTSISRLRSKLMGTGLTICGG